MGLLSTFIVSFLAVLTVFVIKRNEIKSGRQSGLGRLLSKVDPHLVALSKRAQNLFHLGLERASFLFLVHTPNGVGSLLSRVKTKMHAYHHDTKAKIRDKRELSRNTISPYMRSMSFRREGDSF